MDSSGAGQDQPGVGKVLGRRLARKQQRQAKKQRRAAAQAAAARARKQKSQAAAAAAAQRNTSSKKASRAAKPRNAEPAAAQAPARKAKRQRSGTDAASAAKEQPASRKRQRRAEVEVEETPEDAEIRRLEAKLGIAKKAAAGKNWDRVRKEYEEDGFDGEFVDFLSQLDRIAAPASDEAAAKRAKKQAKREKKLAKKAKKEAKKAKKQAKRAAKAAAMDAEPDPEDEVIRRLEKKLGIGKKARKKGGASKGDGGYDKLKKEYLEDGFDEEFVDFLGSLDSRLPGKSSGAHTSNRGAGGGGGGGGNSSSDEADTEESDGELPSWFTQRMKTVGVDLTASGDEHADSDASSSDGHADLEVDADAELDTLPGVTVKPARDPQQLTKLLEQMSREAGMADSDSSDSDSDSDSSDSDDSDDNDDSDDSDDSDSSDDEAARAEARARAAEAAARRKKKQQHLYGENETEITEGAAKPAAYVPPHLRRRAAEAAASKDAEADGASALDSVGAGDSEAAKKRREARVEGTPQELQRLRRRVQGIFNRLSEANVEPMANELASLYRDPQNSVRLLTTVVASLLLECAANEHQVLRALMLVQTVLVAAIHNLIGPEVGALMLERVAERLAEAAMLRDTDSTEEADAPKSKQVHNTLLLLTFLYLFGVVEHELLYDVLDKLVARFWELDVELLLMVMQHAGFNLRSDSPARLRDLIVSLKERAKAKEVEEAKLGTSDGSTRRAVMLNMVYDIKNNRQRTTTHQFSDIVDRGLKLRKWLHRFTARAADSQADRRLRVRWAYLLSPDRSRRWYFEGAAPLVPGERRAGTQMQQSRRAEARGGGHDMMANASAELLNLAKRQRMNTPVRRMIFVAMMGAESVSDAFERVIRLNLKGTAERQIVHVLVDCAGQEAAYNPFYSNLAVRLCQYHARFKLTFQLTFWDTFKRTSDLSTRTLYNLAKLLAHLLSEFQLSLAVVKVVDFTSLKPADALFFRTMFGDLVGPNQPDETIRAVFSRAGAGPDRQLVRDGVLVFLHSYMGAMTKRLAKQGASREQRIAAKVRLRLARKALESVNVDAVDSRATTPAGFD